MNEKLARAIIDDLTFERELMSFSINPDYNCSTGYLEAIEKAKVLEDAVKEFINGRDCVFCDGFGCDHCRITGKDDYQVNDLREALKQWEKIK